MNSTTLTGLKIGAYWSSSDYAGLPRGSSAVVFLDDTTGRMEAVVQTSAANSYRTSAGDALAVELLQDRTPKRSRSSPQATRPSMK